MLSGAKGCSRKPGRAPALVVEGLPAMLRIPNEHRREHQHGQQPRPPRGQAAQFLSAHRVAQQRQQRTCQHQCRAVFAQQRQPGEKPRRPPPARLRGLGLLRNPQRPAQRIGRREQGGIQRPIRQHPTAESQRKHRRNTIRHHRPEPRFGPVKPRGQQINQPGGNRRKHHETATAPPAGRHCRR